MKSSLVHKFGDAYRSAVSMFTGIETESHFEDKGTLTVKEFVEAGDQLVYKFPTWKWKGADGKKVDYLPADKQFLVTERIPCPKRVKDLEKIQIQTSTADDWNLTSTGTETETSETQLSSQTRSAAAPKPQSMPKSLTKLNEALEMMDSGVQNTTKVVNAGMRYYDLSITWDKYYKTPRLWLTGYNGDGSILKEEEIREDVVGDYASKTITVEVHPFTNQMTASIHPCKHAEMMLKVIKYWKQDKETTVRSDLSIFVFLKFISGLVPTINYDFTIDLPMI
jgi:ubiquitin-like-conjugating enzyme ATG3